MNLTKTKNMTAWQFEAEWEQIHADLEEVGLGINKLEKFLAYIVKVGPPISETIRMDRRPRPDGAGVSVPGCRRRGKNATKSSARLKE